MTMMMAVATSLLILLLLLLLLMLPLPPLSITIAAYVDIATVIDLSLSRFMISLPLARCFMASAAGISFSMLQRATSGHVSLALWMGFRTSAFGLRARVEDLGFRFKV